MATAPLQNAAVTVTSFYGPTKPLKTSASTVSAPGHILTPGQENQQLRRSSRTPKPIATNPVPEYKKKRKSDETRPASGDVKKAKVGVDGKANAVHELQQAVNHQRHVQALRRDAFLWAHRDVFEALLPKTSVTFDNVRRNLEAGDVDVTGGKVHFVPEQRVIEQPALVKGGVMKDYQLDGLRFLTHMYQNGVNCILGDEMGLGKTLQTLSLFAWIRENTQGLLAPHLVICPLSVLSSWQSEAKRWLPSLSTLRFHGSANERASIKAAFSSQTTELPDIVITTYECYIAERGWFASRRWTMCVLDEGHKIKNADTHVSGAVQNLGCVGRLILTGTPIQNSLVELWSLLHWLMPTVFTEPSQALFKASFDMSAATYNLNFMDHAKALLKLVMLRRTKDDVEQNIPPRQEMDVFLPLSEAQRFWYLRVLGRADVSDLASLFASPSASASASAFVQAKEENRLVQNGEGMEMHVEEGRREVLRLLENRLDSERIASASSASTGKGESEKGPGDRQWARLMNLLMQLRRVCDHPYLLTNVEPTPYVLGEHVVAASTKLTFIDRLLRDQLLPAGEQVLIFSQWTKMLDVLEDMLALRGIRYARLDGQTRRPRRALDIRLFQRDNSDIQVYIISTSAGGLGINLTKATSVIMCDASWNPQMDLQAVARAHRIGQTKIVKVYKLICRGSVEDQMMDRLRRKLYLSVKIMGTSSSSSASAADAEMSMASGELLSILRRGTGVLADGESQEGMTLEEFYKADIGAVMERSKKVEEGRTAVVRAQLVDVGSKPEGEGEEEALERAKREEVRLLSGIAQVKSRFFEGKVVERKSNKELVLEWEHMEKKRERQDRTVVENGIVHIVQREEQLAVPAAPKRTRAKFEWQDWCVACRLGDELGVVACCSYCPRVFHPKCAGYTLAEVQRASSAKCPQHHCETCARNAVDAGGMLYRCRTCPRSYCEDCLPESEKEPVEYVGDNLPEFELLDYPTKDNAYFIRCGGCIAHHRETEEGRAEWKEWVDEWKGVERKLRAKI